MVQMQEQNMSRRRSTIRHSSKQPLSALASQLHSESDRTHYTKVITMAENLQRRIQVLQRHDSNTCSSTSKAPIPPRKELRKCIKVDRGSSARLTGDIPTIFNFPFLNNSSSR